MARVLFSKLIFIGLLFVIALFDVIDGVSFYGDVDDRMRDYQIRDLLADGRWYDLSFPFIAMPELYVSPWSRLVDFPYVVIAYVLSAMVGEERALFYAYQIWPMTLLILFGLFVHSIIRRSLGSLPSFLELFATAILLVYAVWQFVPGRIDHHNVQLLLVVVASYGLVRWDRMGAIILGLASVASIHVGLEALPIIFVMFLGVCLVWVAGIRGENQDDGLFMAATSLSLMVGVLIFTAIQPGWQSVTAIACDAYSAPYVVACAMVGLLLFIAAKMGAFLQGVLGRFVLLAVFGSGIMATLYFMFPGCLDGPYHMIDPISHAFWLEMIAQERGILSVIGNEKLQPLFAPALVLMVIAPAFILMAIHKLRDGEPAWIILCLAAMVAIFMALYQLRFVQFMALLVPLSMPWCIRNLVVEKMRGGGVTLSSRAVKFIAIAPILIIAGGVGWYVGLRDTTHIANREMDGASFLNSDICEADNGANLAYLKGLAPGRIMAGFGASIAIAEIVTRNNLDHQITALPFHRASPGIRQVAIAFTSASNAERDEVLNGYNYVAVCWVPKKFLATIDLVKVPLFAALVTGKSSEGFELLPPPDGTRLRIYKIVH